MKIAVARPAFPSLSRRAWTTAKNLGGGTLFVTVFCLRLLLWDSWRSILFVEVSGLKPLLACMRFSLPVFMFLAHAMVATCLYCALTLDHAIPERSWGLLGFEGLATPFTAGFFVLVHTVLYERPIIASGPCGGVREFLWALLWPGAPVQPDRRHVGRWIAITQLTCVAVMAIDGAVWLGWGLTNTRDTMGDKATVYVPVAILACVALRLAGIKDMQPA